MGASSRTAPPTARRSTRDGDAAREHCALVRVADEHADGARLLVARRRRRGRAQLRPRLAGEDGAEVRFDGRRVERRALERPAVVALAVEGGERGERRPRAEAGEEELRRQLVRRRVEREEERFAAEARRRRAELAAQPVERGGVEVVGGAVGEDGLQLDLRLEDRELRRLEYSTTSGIAFAPTHRRTAARRRGHPYTRRAARQTRGTARARRPARRRRRRAARRRARTRRRRAPPPRRRPPRGSPPPPPGGSA